MTAGSTGAPISRGSRFTWGLVVFLAGAGTMLFELIAPRMLQPFFGASAFVWTNVIGVILLALALGYEFGGRLAARAGGPGRIARTLALAAAIAFALVFILPTFATWLLPGPEALAALGSPRGKLEFGSLLCAVFLFAPPVFLLATVSPQIVRELVDLGMPAGRGAGRVFMLGTIGSLVGTFLPTYVLVPAFGTRIAMVIAGLMLLAAALIAAKGQGGRTVLRAVAIAAIGLVLGAAGFRGPIRPALAGEELLIEKESALQYLRVVEAPAAEAPAIEETVLRIDEGLTEFHSLRSAGRIGTMGKYYDYFALLPTLFPADRALRVLVLGSGAGTMARLLRDFWGDRIELVVNVELDPAIVALEERFDPGGDRSRFRTLVTDGRAALRLLDERFDIVMIDAYARQVDIPFHMTTVEFFAEVGEHLVDDGVVAINLSLGERDNPMYRALGQSLERVGPTAALKVRFWRNTMMWARRGDAPLLFPEAPVHAELARVQLQARRFADRFVVASKSPIDPLTDDHAPVEGYMKLALEQER
ncbi:MAG: fused MFS/spermidine synthase [Planctomycetes bacterium]|nr:fused MFS/spermidine synthase [Planctomycetota bacterium]